MAQSTFNQKCIILSTSLTFALLSSLPISTIAYAMDGGGGPTPTQTGTKKGVCDEGEIIQALDEKSEEITEVKEFIERTEEELDQNEIDLKKYRLSEGATKEVIKERKDEIKSSKRYLRSAKADLRKYEKQYKKLLRC